MGLLSKTWKGKVEERRDLVRRIMEEGRRWETPIQVPWADFEAFWKESPGDKVVERPVFPSLPGFLCHSSSSKAENLGSNSE